MRALRCMFIAMLMAPTLLVPLQAHAQDPLSADMAIDKRNPARNDAFTIASHGSNMNAVFYLASGEQPHPTVLLLHGFPGNEQNLDLAQSIRRAGWNVLTFHYRGSWGSQGIFSIRHAIEDSATAMAFLREPQNVKRYSIDPQRLVIIGHSMGGFLAARTAQQDPGIRGIGLLTAANMGPLIGDLLKPSATKADLDDYYSSLPPLKVESPKALMREAAQHRGEWDMRNYAAGIAPRPVLIVTAEDDLAPDNDALGKNLMTAGSPVEKQHFMADHSFSDQRIALQSKVISWLAQF